MKKTWWVHVKVTSSQSQFAT